MKFDTLSVGAFAAWVIGALLTILVLSLVFFAETGPRGGALTVIRNVTVIDAVSGRQQGRDVAIKGGVILSVRDTGQDMPGNATLIDGSGKFLIPGLWDAHVHLAYDPQIDYRTFFPLSLAHGITALRDTGGHLDRLAPAIKAAGGAHAPDLYFSGPLIDGANRIYDGSSQFYPDISVGAATPADAERLVDEFAARGASFIKAYEMLTPDVFRAVVRHAATHDMKVAAHVPLSMTAADAIAAGAADFQHMRNLEFSCAQDPAQLLVDRHAMLAAAEADTPAALRLEIHGAQRGGALADPSPENCNTLIENIARAGVAQTPTLTIATFFTRRLFADPAWRETFKLMPAPVREGWETRSARLIDRPANTEAETYVRWIESMLPRLKTAGVPIIAGTDAPIAYLTPGASLHEELVMLVDAGLTPLAALEAATLAPAAFFGKTGETGSVAPGMKADLVLLRADPLADIRNTTAIEAVFKNGHLHDRPALDALKAIPAKLQ